MMKRVIILGAVLAVISCSAPDNKVKLEKLRAEKDKIAQQIQELEKAQGDTGTDKPAEKYTDVVVNEIQPSEFKHYIEIQGKIDAEENTQVNSQTPGVVVAIHTREGAQVKKGQVLAELDTQVLNKSLDEVNTQLTLATDLYNKQKNLWDKKIGSEVQYLSAKANKEALEQRLSTLQEQIQMAKFKSPINGTVEDIPFKVGQAISPGVPGSSIRVINMSRVKVVAEVAEAYSASIHAGDEVIVHLPDFKKDIISKVTFTSRYIDPANRTFTVESMLEDAPIEYRANMIAKLRINDYTNDSALVVPVNLVQNSLSGYFVTVAEKNSEYFVAKRKLVQTGITYNGLTEVISGLETGDKVITTGYMSLKEGERIKLNN
jgi:RND family efflux transporter MFP subunit